MKLDERLFIRLDKGTKDELTKQATKKGLNASTYARTILIKALSIKK